MIKLLLILFTGMIFSFLNAQENFLSTQIKYEHMKTASVEKLRDIQICLNNNKLTINNLNIIIVAYKDEDILEIYAKSNQEVTYRKIKSYQICSRSGELGPKRKQGDGQVPEGLYHISRFNPVSSYYLSLGINYPNLSDKRKSSSTDLGGDIFIHGSCVTIGCLPMTDDYIKEIYLLAVYAKNNGQSKIPVYIFPFRMTDQNMKKYEEIYKEKPELISFWKNLKSGYEKFIVNSKELKFSVNKNGDYIF